MSVLLYTTYSFLQISYSSFFSSEIIVPLIAYVLKSDGDVSTKELRFVKEYLIKEYGERTALDYYELLQPYLNKNLSLTKSLKKISFEEATPTLVHLLNFLIKISIIDGYLKNSEYRALLIICKGLELPRIRLDSMLAMYNYITEDNFKQNQNNQKKRSQKSNQTLSSKRAYTILEIDESASTKDIKKSYRKLVVLYHPDKLIHLDKKFQKGAKEKYQKINDAYELLKKTRGFK